MAQKKPDTYLFQPDYRDYAVMSLGYARMAKELEDLRKAMEQLQDAPLPGIVEAIEYYQQRRDQAILAAQELVQAQP